MTSPLNNIQHKSKKNGLRAVDLDMDDIITRILRAWGLNPGDQLQVLRKGHDVPESLDLTRWLSDSPSDEP